MATDTTTTTLAPPLSSDMQTQLPFTDFDFSFDRPSSGFLPTPPPLPSSADLFTPAETTDLLGFLDNFNWGIDAVSDPFYDESQTHSSYTNFPPVPSAPACTASRTNANAVSIRISPHSNLEEPSSLLQYPSKPTRRPNSTALPESLSHQFGAGSAPPSDQEDHMDVQLPSPTTPPMRGTLSPLPPPQNQPQPIDTTNAPTPRTKTLLSTPQKRLNHILSEQKRRNAIREGYAQLIALLAPAGSPPGLGMPTRGRPKGSGSRGKGRGKGKSGVLFRAVEYTRWLEEGRDALAQEVRRLEAVTGVQP